MAEDLTFVTVDEAGVISSVFLIVGACSSLVWALLANKYSRKKLLIIATGEWSIAALLTIFSYDYYSLLTFQILAAIGFGAVIPITFSMIVDLKAPKERGSAFGWKETNYVLGIGFSQILSGFLISYYPWFIPFIVISIGGFFCTFLLFYMIPPQKGEMDQKPDTSDEESTWIRRQDFGEIAKKRSNIFILLFNLVLFIGLGAVSIYLLAILKAPTDYQFSPDTATIFLIIIYVGQIPSGVLLGNLGDKLFKKDINGRIKVVFFCLILGAILYITAFSMDFTASAPIGIIVLFLIIASTGAFFFGGIDPLLQATLGEINTPRTRSTIYSINYLTYTFGRSISGLLLVWMLGGFGKFRIGFVILSIISLSSVVLLIPVLKTLPRESPKT